MAAHAKCPDGQEEKNAQAHAKLGGPNPALLQGSSNTISEQLLGNHKPTTGLVSAPPPVIYCSCDSAPWKKLLRNSAAIMQALVLKNAHGSESKYEAAAAVTLALSCLQSLEILSGMFEKDVYVLTTLNDPWLKDRIETIHLLHTGTDHWESVFLQLTTEGQAPRPPQKGRAGSGNRRCTHAPTTSQCVTQLQ